jgi:hypothetical protein
MQDLRPELGRAMDEEADAQRAALPPRGCFDPCDGGVGALDDLACVLCEHSTVRRERDAPRRADEQVAAELLLERAGLRRERRLGDMQPLSRSAEVQLLRYGKEVAQVPQLDVH